MTFKRLEKPKGQEDSSMTGHYLDGPGVGGPTGPMFKVDIMCLVHKDFNIGERLMAEIEEAVTKVMDKHLAIPDDLNVEDAKFFDKPSTLN